MGHFGWDAAMGKELNVLNGHTGSVNSVAFSTDGTWIVSGSWDTSGGMRRRARNSMC